MSPVSETRPTIRDVAQRAEVSLSTVSAVLNATAPASRATRLRVLAAVAELGYEPNSQARNLKRNRSHAIGLIVPDVLNPFFALVAEGIGDEVRRRDYVLVLCSTDSDAAREQFKACLSCVSPKDPSYLRAQHFAEARDDRDRQITADRRIVRRHFEQGRALVVLRIGLQVVGADRTFAAKDGCDHGRIAP